MSSLHRIAVRARRATPVDLTSKLIVVTGGTAGSVGRETARLLTSWGAEVITTTRSGGTHPPDLTEPTSVRTFADWFSRTHGERLDALVNNAGVHLDLMSAWKQPAEP